MAGRGKKKKTKGKKGSSGGGKTTAGGRARRPRRAYKPVYKGVRYLASKLHKYYPKRYPSYAAALPRAREIFADIQASAGAKVRLNELFARERRRRSRQADPILPPELETTSHYWELQDYPRYILQTDDRIHFKSLIFNHGAPQPLMGGDDINYSDWFSEFVTFVNQMVQAVGDQNRYQVDWFVKCTTPVYNPSDKLWESWIISADDMGGRVDYGFKPNAPLTQQDPVAAAAQLDSTTAAQNPGTPDASTKTTTKTATNANQKTQPDDIKLIQAQQKLEELRIQRAAEEARAAKNSALNTALQLFQSGAISKAELKEITRGLE